MNLEPIKFTHEFSIQMPDISPLVAFLVNESTNKLNNAFMDSFYKSHPKAKKPFNAKQVERYRLEIYRYYDESYQLFEKGFAISPIIKVHRFY